MSDDLTDELVRLLEKFVKIQIDRLEREITEAIYRERKLIWSKTFDPPENGVLELEEPVAVEKGDLFWIKLEWQKPIGHRVEGNGTFVSVHCTGEVKKPPKTESPTAYIMAKELAEKYDLPDPNILFDVDGLDRPDPNAEVEE